MYLVRNNFDFINNERITCSSCNVEMSKNNSQIVFKRAEITSVQPFSMVFSVTFVLQSYRFIPCSTPIKYIFVLGD